ncbi:NACHT domain-containing protein [Lysinibacillus xylanilyticus]|uniref:NACHT domain-containing protein n=1 Tax=Lysinibacillus xylanilyticus TaxID=582475 RepID=UPI0037F7F2E7
MNIKFLEKKSNFEDYIFEALAEDSYDDCLNKARKAAEALCKSIIYMKINETEATEFISGKRTVNNQSVASPRILDLNGLIQLVTTSNSTYVFISDKNERDMIKNTLETIRLLGNNGSHDRDSVREGQIKLEQNILKGKLLYLTDWCYKNIYSMQMPNKISQVVKERMKLEVSATTQEHEVKEVETFYNLLREWLEIVEYSFGAIEYNLENDKFFDIEIPGRRNSIERILVISTIDSINYSKAQLAAELKDGYDCSEVWIVTPKTISASARKYGKDVYCYTFDELIEESFSLESYFGWLDEYVNNKRITENFIQLNCEIREEHNTTKRIIAKSNHEITNYADRWLEHNNKDHLSILGDFGTGKTWFSLYYAWRMKQKYKEAKQKGLPRPRIPIVIFLREYVKAVSVETLISDFFFRKHQIDLKGAFSAFNFLNKHGKLLIIFDGFDEMSDRINKQKMIDNFWELASVIKGKAKVILTCRNEHFPEIKEGRAVLKAELKESTKHLTGTTPQFETVYLELLNQEQIKEILIKHVNEESIEKLLKNQTILDLLKRPIMLDLILESIDSLSDLENLDLATIYFYATKNKLTRDIKEERTFTSLADKYFFMCEISQEMLINNKLSISYREFPNLIRDYFSRAAKDDEIDYWRYDMHGQTLLIIDEDGQYKPAHKSFLEFFLTFKYVAMLGLLKSEYLEVVMERNDIDYYMPPKQYTWDEYFKVERNGNIEKSAPLSEFSPAQVDELAKIIGKDLFTKPMCELAVAMIDWNKASEIDNLLNELKGKEFEEIGYLATNLIFILLMKDTEYGIGKDFSRLCLRNLDLNLFNNEVKVDEYNEIVWYSDFEFKDSNFYLADLRDANLFNRSSWIDIPDKYNGTIFDEAYLHDNFFYESQIDDICIVKENKLLVGAHNELLLLDTDEFKVIKRLEEKAWQVFYLEDKKLIVVSNWFSLNIYDTDLNFIRSIKVTKTENEYKEGDEGNGWLAKFYYNEKEKELIAFASNSTVYKIDMETYTEIEHHILPYDFSRVFSNKYSNYIIIEGYGVMYVYDPVNNIFINEVEHEERDKFGGTVINIHPTQDLYFVAKDNKVELREISNNEMKSEIIINEDICFVEFNENNNLLYCFLEHKIILVEIKEGTLKKKSEMLFDLKEIYKRPDMELSLSLKFSFEKVVFLEKDKILLFIANTIICYSVTEKKILTYFKRFTNLLGSSFRKCEGINGETKQLIYQNGGEI